MPVVFTLWIAPNIEEMFFQHLKTVIQFRSHITDEQVYLRVLVDIFIYRNKSDKTETKMYVRIKLIIKLLFIVLFFTLLLLIKL